MSKLLSVNEVSEMIGLSRTTIWRMEKAGNFPTRRHLSARRIGWLEADIEAWITTRSPSVDANPLGDDPEAVQPMSTEAGHE